MRPCLKDRLAKAVTAVHNALYRRTGGRIGSRIAKAPVLLLTTTGRKSGKAHTTPLVYVSDGDRLVLVASYGGDDRSPAWFHNLVAHPEVTVEVGGDRREMQATVAGPEEKSRLWPMAVAVYNGYAGYQRKTSRDIPMVILSES